MLNLEEIKARCEAAIDRLNRIENPTQPIRLSLQDIPALIAEVERLRAEWDAAVEDLNTVGVYSRHCRTCKWHGIGNGCKERREEMRMIGFCPLPCWQWRGMQENNDEFQFAI